MPARSRAQLDKRWVEDRFGDADDVSTLLLDRRVGSNLLSKEALLEVFDLYDAVLAIDSQQGTKGYDARSCAKAYARPGVNQKADGAAAAAPTRTFRGDESRRGRGRDADESRGDETARRYWDAAQPCQKAGILAFWNWDRATLEADPDVVETVNAAARDCCSPAGRAATVDRVAAKVERDPTGRVMSIGALRLDFYLTARKHEKTGADPTNLKLESKFDRLRHRTDFVHLAAPMPLTENGLSENVGGAFDHDRAFVDRRRRESKNALFFSREALAGVCTRRRRELDTSSSAPAAAGWICRRAPAASPRWIGVLLEASERSSSGRVVRRRRDE